MVGPMARLHRLDRRSFLHDLGRGAVAVAVFGPVVAACGGDDDDSTPAASTTESTAPTTAGSDGPTTDALRWERVDLGFVSAFVLARGDRAAIVDTGVDGSAGDIAGVLDTIGLGWDSVDHLILTHAHGDHVGSAGEVVAAAPAATVHAGAADIASIDIGRDIAVASADDDIFGLQVVPTPGHTAGHISVYDPTTRLLVAGDALRSESGAVVGSAPEFTADLDAAAESARRLAALDIDTILFGHGQPIVGGADSLLDVLVDG